MVRKIFFILVSILLFQLQSQAVETKNVLNLKTGNSYLLPTNSRPMSLKNSNPAIVTAEAVTNFEESDSSILITTKREGIAYITFKQKEKEVTLRLLIDNLGTEDTNIIKLDVPQGRKP